MASSDINTFYDLLGSSKNIIAVAGAGLSAASGIPTFRGAGGMWRKCDAVSLATPEGFRKNPSLVWQFYHYRRESALKAQPNPAHLALSSFSLPSIRHQIAPGSTFTLITQNVDGLSVRADKHIQAKEPPAADEQPRIIEIHGRLFDVSCTSSHCDHVEFNTTSPICEGLSGTEALVAAGDLDPEIPVTSLPRCARCGSLARPGVVWFGERPHKLDEIDKLVAKADLCLVIGTSSTASLWTCPSVAGITDRDPQVYPAAGYAAEVQLLGGKVAVFNLDRSEGDDDADYLFLGPCEETLPRALGLTR